MDELVEFSLDVHKDGILNIIIESDVGIIRSSVSSCVKKASELTYIGICLRRDGSVGIKNMSGFDIIDAVALLTVCGKNGIVGCLRITAGYYRIVGILRPVRGIKSGLGIDVNPDLIAKGAFYEVLAFDLNGYGTVLVFGIRNITKSRKLIEDQISLVAEVVSFLLAEFYFLNGRVKLQDLLTILVDGLNILKYLKVYVVLVSRKITVYGVCSLKKLSGFAYKRALSNGIAGILGKLLNRGPEVG